MTFNPDNPLEHLEPWQKEKIRATATPALKASRGPLEWQQGSRWHLVTGDGYYTVAKTMVNRVARYGAWYRPNGKGTDIAHHLGERDSADLAKALAQHHADIARSSS